MNKPLSNQQISKALNIPEDDIILYKKLHQCDTIDDLFKDDLFKIILFETKAGFGHWVSLLKDKDKYIFFDSYGLAPDAELRFVLPLNRLLLGEDHRELTRLLRGKKVIYNKVKFQGKESSTCGRYQVAWFDYFKMGYSLPEFQRFMKKHKTKSYDNLICHIVDI